MLVLEREILKTHHRVSRIAVGYLKENGDTGGSRTPDLMLRRHLLYPTELRYQRQKMNRFQSTPLQVEYQVCRSLIFIAINAKPNLKLS